MRLGKIFTQGNDKDLDDVCNELDKLNVAYNLRGNILYFDENEVNKLPVDGEGHYLPACDGTGYSYYIIFDDEIN